MESSRIMKPEVQSSLEPEPEVQTILWGEESWKVVRWSPSDPMQTHRFQQNLKKSSCTMSQKKLTACVT